MSVSFLSMLLRAAIYLETTVACRLDLEKMMGMQLGQAVLDDILIPSYSFTGDTLFDVETVQRILTNFLDFEMGSNGMAFGSRGDDDYVSPPPSELEQVGKLMENYLAEIALDRNLSVSMFIGLAELVPEQSRVTEDGIYRAIDIYLKAHPVLSNVERKKVCSLMDCQKLSREARAHAAQNDRLPVHTVVQVFYYEQQRLRDNMNVSGGDSPSLPSKPGFHDSSHHQPDELSSLCREADDLKVELLKMKTKMKDFEGSSSSADAVKPSSALNSPRVGVMGGSADRPPLPRRSSFMNSVSKKLGRLYPFVRSEGGLGHSSAKGRGKACKDKRHSIS